ncbi:pyrimidine-specific ribonucleoside hydrolase RihA-like isoform X1 [Macrosteles quadrilineatus]|uniref:pyrimidine-specific ribonucleoside hydrolase RihA-like isoform X1 n=2 Tax=Macrosteles quadrilineatus TaxID=74068 RepID=UPI0023E17B13|nr:pyrimidine-specific ribonucleoside hydrolase RihA-like isoform X1 [Macrosteles quadrilineatus]
MMFVEDKLCNKSSKIVIIDTDAGIDDAWAILMLLAASQSENVSVAGITCVHGNAEVDQICLNVLRTLEASKRPDIPVFKGASSPIIEVDPHFKNSWRPFFGADGFGCAEHKSMPDPRFVQEENGIVALNRLVNENKGNVSLLCFGPLTNVALAIRTFPSFEENLKEVLIMGGNYMAVGNSTNCAEFNFHFDPEAAYIVLNSAIKRKVLVPWETCCHLAYSLEWRDNVLGSCQNGGVQFLNHVERPLRKKPSFVDWVACDQAVAAIFLDPTIACEIDNVFATVELHGQHTRGQVVVGHKFKREPNLAIVKSIDKERFTEQLLKVHTLK